MLGTPFPPWPSYMEEEANAVTRVLLSNRVNYWTGEEGRHFEREFAIWSGTQHAVALANGTVALDLALRVLDIGPGDEVVVTPRTFVASASTIIHAGARPVFADVDPVSQNITAKTVSSVLSPRTKAIVCVHFAGWPCEMDEINALAAAKGLQVIEDCAQAHGARYKGRSVGSLSRVAAWSFCQDKIISTGGEGGMLTTSDEELWRRAWSFKDHGKSWEAVYQKNHPPGYRWLHDNIGTNWRLTEMQSAIGRIQLNRMPMWHAKRARNATAILEEASTLPILETPHIPDHIDHAWYKAYLFIRPEQLASSWSRDRIMYEINQRGVPCYTGSCSEVYLEKAFSSMRPDIRLPVARKLGETSLMFLVHPTLSARDISRTCDAIRSVCNAASRRN